MVTHRKSKNLVWISGLPRSVPPTLPTSFLQLRGSPICSRAWASCPLLASPSPADHWPPARPGAHCCSPLCSPARSLPGLLALACVQMLITVFKFCTIRTGAVVPVQVSAVSVLSETVQNNWRAMTRESGHPNSSPILLPVPLKFHPLGTESNLITE